jgi:hypothetical protein
VNRLALAVVLLVAAPARGATPDDLAGAERAFAEGVALREDSAKARPAFARAAAHYDALWTAGHRAPDLALARARAHRLAGNLPRGVAALHDGLAHTRHARALQVELDDARAAVPLPLEGELADQCRTRPARGIGSRVSPADAWVLAAALWLLACAAGARFAMTRGPVWLALAGLIVVALVALGTVWVRDARRHAADNALPLLVVTDDAILRKGNGDAFPARLEPAVPRGAEARELARRGGWVQVQLPGGAVGWLPAARLLACGN